jgi:hypothetical protein
MWFGFAWRAEEVLYVWQVSVGREVVKEYRLVDMMETLCTHV